MFSTAGRSAVVGSLLAAALAGVAAPPAGADEPPAPPADTVLPKEPGNAPRATALLRAGGNEQLITLRLACRGDGKVTLSAVAPKRHIGSTRFACRRDRAVARIRMPGEVARAAHRQSSLDAVATVMSGGERTRFDLKTRLTRAGDRRLLAVSRWYVPAAWCTGVGFTMSVDNTTRFSAEYGETVWWQPIGMQVGNYSGAVTWRYGTWQSYVAVPGDGGYLRLPDGQFQFNWTVTQSAGIVASRYDVSIYPAIQIYTARGGYRWWFIPVTSGYGYGEEYVDACGVVSP